MEITNTTIITAIFGLVWLGVGLSSVLNPQAFHNALENFYKDPALMLFGGILSIVIGAIIMVFHFRWNTSWESLISIIGIVSFLKGITYMAMPESMINLKKSMVKSADSMRAWGILTLLIGLAFLYLAVI